MMFTVRSRKLIYAVLIVFMSSAMGYGILFQQRFSFIPFVQFRLLLLLLAAISALWSIRIRIGRVRLLFVLPMLVLTSRFVVPYFESSTETPTPFHRIGLSDAEVTALSALRMISAAQEDHRLLHGFYSLSNLLSGDSSFSNASGLEIITHGDSVNYWQAVAKTGSLKCSIYGGMAPAAISRDAAEGVPSCETSSVRLAHQAIGVVHQGVGEQESRGEPSSRGEWAQHRFDPARSGGVQLGSQPAYSWRSFVNGEIRASASVAGEQVFVGSHGNGEVAALDLRSGARLWRRRAPNWIHHEPVVGRDQIVYGFGNNELFGPVGNNFGTPPSGFEAVDRRTGRLLWRQFTGSSSMNAPVIYGTSLIARETSGIVHSWNIQTGGKIWELSLPGHRIGPMTNPLLVDTSIVILSEPGNWFIVSANTGELLRKGSIPGAAWGAGHVSPAYANGIIVFSFIERGRTDFLSNLLGINFRAERVSVVALDFYSGTILWKVTVSGKRNHVPGHIAGTPVIQGEHVYVSLPTVGSIVSIRIRNGRLNWNSLVEPARGSVSINNGKVFAATLDSKIVVLDQLTGNVLCRARTSSRSDRAGLTVQGRTGILTFVDGTLRAAPLSEWFRCKVVT